MVTQRRLRSIPVKPTNLMFEYVSTLIAALLMIFNSLWPTNLGLNTAVINVGLVLIVVSASFGTVALKLPKERGFRLAAIAFAVLATMLFVTNGVAMAVLPMFLDCRTNTHSSSVVVNACSYVTAFLIISITMSVYGSVTSILFTIKYIRHCKSPYQHHQSSLVPTSVIVMPRSLNQKYYDASTIDMPPPIDLLPSPPPYSQHEFDLGTKPTSS